jgi:hypothetical protein
MDTPTIILIVGLVLILGAALFGPTLVVRSSRREAMHSAKRLAGALGDALDPRKNR